MLALLKEIIGAVSVAEVIELPRLSRGAPTSHRVLIDQNLDCTKVAGEVTSICIRLGNLQRRDLRVVLSSCWSRVPQPLLQLKKRHRVPSVVELGRDGRPGAVAGDVAAHICKRDTGFFTESRDERLVEIVYSYPGEANEEEKLYQFASFRVGEFCTLWTHLFPGSDGLSDNPIYRLGESSSGLVD